MENYTWEFWVDFDEPKNFWEGDLSIAGGSEVNFFDDIKKAFIGSVIDIWLSPGNGISEGWFFERVDGVIFADEFVVVGFDVFFEDVDVDTLDVTVVDGFVKEFVDDDKVVFDAFLFYPFKVAFEDFEEVLEEFYDHHGVDVLAAYGQDWG